MDANAMANGDHMADTMMDGKPVCGGNKQVGEYDVGIHILGLCESPTLL
jgi:zinc transporter 1/2/3